MTDNEIMAFSQGYRLGFHAGQLERRRYSLACHQLTKAVIAGHNIALTRGSISLEEYKRIIKSGRGENTC